MITKHKFQSQKADGTDVTLVKPSDWNDDHDIQTEVDGVALGRAAGAGPGPVQELPLSALMPTGLMMLWPGVAAPAGWMLCQGQSVSRATYPGLFAICGTAYGSVDGGSFNLPDMRGRVPAGVDPGTGRLTTNTINTPAALGGVGGQEGDQQYADITVSGNVYGSTSGAQSFRVYGQTDTFNGVLGTVGGGPATQSHSHWHDGYFNTDGNALSVGASGTMTGGGYVRWASNVQPTLLVNYIIKVG